MRDGKYCIADNVLSLTEPIEFIPRLSGLGLGATQRAHQETTKRIKKPGEEERKVHACV